jgi:methyl-accepting chemotaxis protein
MNNKEVIDLLAQRLSKVLEGKEGKLDIRSLSKEFKPLGKDINLVIESLQEKIKRIKDKEKELKKAVSIFEGVLAKLSMGDLNIGVDLKKISKDYQLVGKEINKLIESLKREKERKEKKEKELRHLINLYCEILDRVVQGHLKSRIYIKSSNKGLERLRRKTNSVIGSLEYYTSELSQSREKEERHKKYFEAYSKRAIELADSWGMGEVFKHEMEEWAKKQK